MSWYDKEQEKMAQLQANLSRENVKQAMQTGTLPIGYDKQGNTEFAPTPEHMFDPDTAPKQGHIWVDRGLKLSCEGAPHANHQAWKRSPM